MGPPERGATEPAQSQDKVQQTIDGTSPERGVIEPAQSQDKVQQSIHGTSPERGATEPAQSQDKVQQSIDGTSPERGATETAQSQDTVQQSIDGTSPERGATEPAQSQDKVQQTIDGTSDERGATEPAQSQDKVQQTIDGTSKRGATEPIPFLDTVQQTTVGTSPERGVTELTQSQDTVVQTTNGTPSKEVPTEPISSQDAVPPAREGCFSTKASSKATSSQSSRCNDLTKTKPEEDDGDFSSSDNLPLSAFSKRATSLAAQKSNVNNTTTLPEINEGSSTSDEMCLASLRAKIHSQQAQNLITDERPSIESKGLSAKPLQRNIKSENVTEPLTSKQASASDIKQKKKREDRPKMKQAKRKAIDTPDGEADSENYDSDEDFNIITAGNESQDFSSDSGDNDSSDDEQESVGIKWSNKLRRISPKEFKGPEPGAIKQLSETASPLNHFYQIFPEKLFSLMAKSTNTYIPIYEQSRRRKSKDGNWVDQSVRETTIDDIRAYTGIRMIIAVDPKPSVDDYWSANPALGNQKIIQTMPRRRFLSMQRYFHVNDPAKDPTRMTDKEKGKELLEKNPLYKVSPLMEAIRKNSMALYNLHQEIAVDEAMIKCHGQHSAIVGAPNKPAKRGFKIFVAADGVSGYLWNFQCT